MSESIRDSTENPELEFDVNEPFSGWVFSGGTFSDFPLSLLYKKEDPYATVLRFWDIEGGEPTDWIFSRQLLDEGYAEKTGEGDIIMEPEQNGFLTVHIAQPNTKKLDVFLPMESVRTYLDRAEAVVPNGTEQQLFDDALSGWLAEVVPIIKTTSET
jgi:hypothetical protein